MKRVTLAATALAALGLSMATAGASEYEGAWGPLVGSKMPVIAAPDQHGALRQLGDLGGERGLLLFFNRSADW